GAGLVVVRDVGLGNGRLEAVLGELVGAERTGEEAALVGALFQLEHEGAVQRGLAEDHANAAPSLDASSDACIRASSQKNWSSIWPVPRRCWSIFRRVNRRDSNSSVVRPMLSNTPRSSAAPFSASQSQEKPGSCDAILSKLTR